MKTVGRLHEINDSNRSAVFILSTGALDRDGETVDPHGGDFEDYRKNPVVIFNHNTDDLPIGISAEPDGKLAIWEGEHDGKPALFGRAYFSSANPKGQLVFDMVKEGTLRGCSISFMPLGEPTVNAVGGKHYSKWKLLEWSVCPVGSNPDAIKLKLKGLPMKRKIWTCKNRAWLKSEDGPVGNALKQYLEERGLDDIQVSDTEPDGDEWTEETLEPEKAKGGDEYRPVQSQSGKYYVVDRNNKPIAGPFPDLWKARSYALEANHSMVSYSADDGIEKSGNKYRVVQSQSGKYYVVDQNNKPIAGPFPDAWKARSYELEANHSMVSYSADDGIEKAQQIRQVGGKWAIFDTWDNRQVGGWHNSKEDAERFMKENDEAAQAFASRRRPKKLSKNERSQLEELTKFLDETADAAGIPSHVSAALKWHSTKAKELTPDQDKVVEEPLTDEDEEKLELAIKELEDGEGRLKSALFRATGLS
jgi:hypothetical protein